jgi:F-type H+-transporting ATPase subunit epsilon
MAATFHCTLVTPERSVIDTEATYADLPAHDGQLGVMSGRAAMLVKLGVGPLRLDLVQDNRTRFALDGGFAQMRENHLTLVCENAVSAEDLSADDARAQLREAEQMPRKTVEEVEARDHALAYARTLVKLATG